MKNIVFILLSVFAFTMLQAQHQLNETDTSIRYKEIFYENDTLSINPMYLYFDSILDQYVVAAKGTEIDKDANPPNTTSYVVHGKLTKITLLKYGSWKLDYEVKGKKYYLLGNYLYDLPIGKSYEFDNENRLVATYTRYPTIQDTIFNGYQTIHYNQGIITSIEYKLFKEDQTHLFYFNRLSYNKNGTLKFYFFDDEATGTFRYIVYSKKGEIMSDYKKDISEFYDRKWNKKRTRLWEMTYEITNEKREKVIRVYQNGVLKQEKRK
ncbi:MAG TPA: hypothetical protein PLP27_05385 [Crocinitomicaceae bacterium]|nr:hypothetical protein [Crocinitomicaceae bacterium]